MSRSNTAQSSATQQGPPYAPTTAGVGGVPTVTTDIPILAVFMLFYLVGAISNMAIFQLNRRRGHKFIMSGLMFGFCVSRIVTCTLRMVWATRPTNISVAIASQIFTNVGITIVYIVNLVLAQRILRATQPRLGWNQHLRRALIVSDVLVFVSVVLLISFTVLMFYTLDTTLLNDALWIQRAATTYLLLFNVFAMVLLAVSVLLPSSSRKEDFGAGSMRSKMIILGVAVFFCNFIAGFKAGTTWAPTRPASDPAWFDSKAAFYVFTFTFENIVLYTLIFTRFDRRFWVPNGSKGPGDYHKIDGVSELKREMQEEA